MKPSWTNGDVTPVLLPAAPRLATPWKNGGGVSFDIAFGAGRGPDGFDWRAGISAIDQAGPFSSYVGYGRCLWLASGPGLALDFRGQPGAWIDRPGEGVQFDGGLATDCRLLRGPVRVLNFMHLTAAPPTQPRLITPDFAVSGPAVVVVAGFVTLYLAIANPDPVVDADYYRKGVEINKTLGTVPSSLAPAMAGRNHAATGVVPVPKEEAPVKP